MAKMSKQSAIRLTETLSRLLTADEVRFCEIDGDMAIQMPGEHVSLIHHRIGALVFQKRECHSRIGLGLAFHLQPQGEQGIQEAPFCLLHPPPPTPPLGCSIPRVHFGNGVIQAACQAKGVRRVSHQPVTDVILGIVETASK